MLQLQSNNINICLIGKLLVKYNIKASITDSVITLDGDISDDLLTQLCNEISINFITNFVSNEPLPENLTTFCQNRRTTMKKLMFKIDTKKESSLTSLLKEVSQFSCRIQLGLENNIVTVENVNDTMIDSVVDLIDNHYTVLSIDINNTSSETVEESSKGIVVAKQPQIFEPQTPDDLIINKIHFENKYIEETVNELLKTTYWAMFKEGVSETKIGDYIYTTMSEISMRYSTKDSISFNVGDVVDCYYGIHLWGEINGFHVPSIVCHISNNGMPYVVPITGSNISSPFTLGFNIPEDVIYEDKTEARNIALLDKGKYVCKKRFNSIIGKTSHTFFEKLLKLLPLTFDFTGCLPSGSISAEKDVCNVSENAPDTVESVVTVVPEVTTTSEVTVASKVEQKLGKEEAAMLEVIGFALDKLDSSKPFNEQLVSFLADIDMPATDIIKQTFTIACDIDKITYGYIIKELDVHFYYLKRKRFGIVLKETFKTWLEKYPVLQETCPRISLMPMLKLFAKKFK